MNELYANEWSNLQNFFCPCSKLVSKEKIGARYTKKYDKPKTPYQRLMNCPDIDEEKKRN
jgi:hypothetical protein